MNTASIKPPFSRQVYSSLFMSATLFLLVFSSCSDQAKLHRQEALDDMNAYVKVHKDSIDNYLDKSWDDLDQGFSQKKAVLDNDVDKMSAEMKESYNNTLRDWDSVKADYSDKVAEKKKMARVEKIRVPLYVKAAAANPKKLDFSDLGPGDMEAEYQNFVDVVKQNKEEYTTEDWTMVNKTWKELNKRKREIKDSIPMGDVKKILKLQIDYTAIKAVNRPIAESNDELE